MVTKFNRGITRSFYGLAADEKPVDAELRNIQNGAIFYVIDWLSAGDVPMYVFDKESQTWHPQDM